MKKPFKIERRSTHSDLAKILLDHAERLEALPHGSLIGDASTVNMIRGTAEALILLDLDVERKTVALRECYQEGCKAAAKALS